MGLSSSKTSTGPSKQALPYITGASSALQGAYDSNAGNLADISGDLRSQFDAFGANMQNDPTLNAARGYVQNTLGTPYGANPELENQINQTNDSVTDRINALFSKAGQTGSSRQVGELGKQLSNNESNLRYTDWNNDQARRAAAVQSALGLGQLGNQTAETYAGLGQNAAQVPYLGAQMLAGGLGDLWGNAQTTTGSQGIGGALLGAGATLGAAYLGRK